MQEKLPNKADWSYTHIGFKKGYFSLYEVDGKTKIKYNNGYEDYYDDPEEKVRAELYSKLIEYYHYQPTEISMEVYPTHKRPHYPSDIVIYEKSSKKPYAVIECKLDAVENNLSGKKREELIREGVLQAFENSHLMHPSPKIFGYYSKCDEEFFEYGDYIKSEIEYYAIPDLTIAYGKPPKYKYIKESSKKDKEKINDYELKKLLKNCHQIIWHDTKKSSIFAFHEMVRILYLIIEDENRTRRKDPYQFQMQRNVSIDSIGNNLKALFINFAKSRKELFEIDVEVTNDDAQSVKTSAIQGLTISNLALVNIVKKLQKVSFKRSGFDAKGAAFEAIASRVFRGEYGGFFTPRTLVDGMVGLIDAVKEIDPQGEKIIDPACGSGGMLIGIWKFVIQEVIPRYTSDPLQIMKDSTSFAAKKLYGIEIVPDVAQVAMINMILREDGSTNIELGSGLSKCSNYANKGIKKGGFGVVISNPPFGDKITDIEAIEELGGKELPSKKSIKSDAAFLVRAVELLEEGGRAAIILPDSILNNPTDFIVRDYVRKHARVLAILSLPIETFMSAKATINTSIVVLQKEKVTKLNSKKITIGEKKAISFLNLEKKKEISNIQRMIDFTTSEKVKEQLKSRLNYCKKIKWKRMIEDESDLIFRKVRDYNIFLAEINKVGVDATGRSCTNKLPEVVNEFKKFIQNGESELKFHIDKDASIKTVHYSDFSRWDALYYQTRFKENIAKIEEHFGKHYPLSYYFDISPETYSPVKYDGSDMVHYIEISAIEISSGEIKKSQEKPLHELPSRAKWILREGDLLISLTRPYRGAIAMAKEENDGDFATSGFLVLRPRKKGNYSEFTQAFLRSSYGQMQLEQMMTGGSYPAIGIFEVMEKIRVPISNSMKRQKIIDLHIQVSNEALTKKTEALSILSGLGNMPKILTDKYNSLL